MNWIKSTIILSVISILVSCNMPKAVEHNTGVWVSDSAELLLTDKIMLYFEKQPDNSVIAMVKIDSITDDCCIFNTDTIIRGVIPTDFNIENLENGDISVNGNLLVKAETFKMSQPYDMTEATDSTTLGERLTEWRLGSTIGVDSLTKDIVVEVNTPRNMFIYYILNGMYYLRAARIENVNKGTLFYQNIRLMRNPNTHENTVYFSSDNKAEVTTDLKINPDGFKPDLCYFDPKGGIYWSYTSHTRDQIILNGCAGDTYYINRRKATDENMFEWIKP